MTMVPTKRYIDEVLGRTLVEPLEDLLGRKGWSLISWDPEQGLCLTIGRGDTVLLIECEARNVRADCYARTALFNVCARDPIQARRPLADDERRLVDDCVGLLASAERELPSFERPTTGRKVALREIAVDRVLIPEGHGQYYINPYVGCMIGCPFCYIRDRADFSRSLEGLPRVRWGRWADVKVNAAEVLRAEVLRHRPGVVRMSPILTDPYQPIERRYRITRQCLEALLGTGFVPAVLTRAARILEDLQLLQQFPRALVGFSIPTDQDRYRRIFEPGADPIADRIDALARLHRAGLTTVALIQPLLPMDVEALVDQVAPWVSAVRIDRMYALDLVGHLYLEHDLAAYAEDAYFEDTQAALVDGFVAAGVRVDEMDDLESLF